MQIGLYDKRIWGGNKLSVALTVVFIGISVFALELQAKKGTKNPVYTVANFEVWGEARNAVAAKKAALEDGKRVALSLLLKRLTLFDPQVQLPSPDTKTVSKLITSLSVRDERNSNTEYLAKLDFQFSEKGVKELLRSARIPYFERQASMVTVIPIVDKSLGVAVPGAGPQKPQITEKEWRESWQTLDLAHGITPLQVGERLPVVDASVLAALVKGESQAFQGLREAYKGKLVAIALLSSSQSPKKLKLTIAGFDTLGELHYKRDHIVSGGDVLQAADLAAEVAFGMFEARWKLLKIRPRVAAQEMLPWNTKMQADAPLSGWESESQGSRVEMQVQFSGLRHWQSIRQRLSDVTGLDDLNIDQLSARGARVSCLYPGGVRALQAELASRNLRLELDGEVWKLRDG